MKFRFGYFFIEQDFPGIGSDFAVHLQPIFFLKGFDSPIRAAAKVAVDRPLVETQLL